MNPMSTKEGWRLVTLTPACETIGGRSLEESLPSVLLHAAYSPVLPAPLPQDWSEVPQPVEVVRVDAGYILSNDPGRTVYTAEALRVMRARFLLWRDHLLARAVAGELSSFALDRVIRWYLGGYPLVMPPSPDFV